MAVSVALAIFASYVALGLATRVAAARMGSAAAAWTMGGALALGSGIWTMHFVGMLAHSAASLYSYDPMLTMASLLLAIAGSGAAIWVATRPQAAAAGRAASGCILGLGISGMHYLGMAAISGAAQIRYNIPLVILSVMIAVAAAMLAVSVTFGRQHHACKAKGAVLLGLTISGMHYAGMLAADIPVAAASHVPGADRMQLGIGVSLATFIILNIALVASIIDSHLGAKATENARRLEAANTKLRLQAEELGAANARLRNEVEERRRSEAKITHLAHHDPLTGLPNRRLFSEHVKRAIRQAERHGKKLGVLLIDLDRFKTVNDTKGHDAGDLLLQELAVRLKHCLREGDIAARLGGDEFVVLLEDLHAPSVAAHVAKKVISVAKWPFVIDGQEFHITSSVGISLYPADGADEQSLLKTADMAMYRSKKSGKDCYHFYSADLNEDVSKKLAVETQLRYALDREQITLHYQPKVDLATGRLAGVEALMRWKHPVLGNVPPSMFIPLAEETGMIHSLGRWAFEQACRQATAWRDRGYPPFNMAVNLSVKQFDNKELHNQIRAVLSETGMAPALLELEVTESMFMHDVEAGRAAIARLKSSGVRIAIDDFGTGYSSLSTLKFLPVDTLKVDGSFVAGISSSVKDQGITRAIIEMAKTLDVQVVAEAVETVEQSRFLRTAKCDLAQGYLYSRPLSAEQLESTLLSRQSLLPA